MSDLTVVPFTGSNINDIPAGLRNLADLIEHGAQEGQVLGMADLHNLIWITLDSDGRTEVGALGKTAGRYEIVGITAVAMNRLGEGR